MKMNRFVYCAVILQALLLLSLAPAMRAAEDAADRAPVSRQEYEELKAEMQALKKELNSLKKEKQAASAQPTQATAPSSRPMAAPAPPAESPKEVASPPSLIPELETLGTTRFLIAGYGEATFEAQNHNISSFEASFNPIFLWELAPKLLFESQIELQLSDSGTDVGLEYAQITYLLNDYITLGAGAMLAPSNIFVERFQALWINKLPDRPLAVYDGFLPETIVGAEIRGGFPIGPTRANYAFYVSNGPALTTNDPGGVGELNFSNFTDNNDNKAVGGRVGFLPVPGVEVG